MNKTKLFSADFLQNKMKFHFARGMQIVQNNREIHDSFDG